jgi:rod shape-determining protein MreD
VRALISFVLVAMTVVFQLTVVDRIAFPGGSAPDLVLLIVVALALSSGPMTGSLTGFWAGLALDVAPPGSHFTGQDALVFCLIGYACGLLADDSSGDGVTEAGHTALFEIVVTAAGAACGEAVVALLGVMLSDPRVTWPAITHVLPVAVAYDALLCPFVLYAAAAALRLAGTRDQARRVGWSPARAGTPMPVSGLGAVRQLGGNTPRLRMADRGKGQGSLGGRSGLGSAMAGGHGSAFTAGGSGGAAKVRFGSRRHDGVLAASLRSGSLRGASLRSGSLRSGSVPGGSMLGGNRPAGSALRGSRFSSSSVGRSWLGGSVFSRPSSSLGPSSPFGRSATFSRSASLGRASPLRHRGNVMRPPGGLGGHARGSGLGQLTGARRTLGLPKSPGRGWLRRTRRSSYGRGAMGRKAMGRGAFGPARLHMPRPKSRRRWRTGGYR